MFAGSCCIKRTVGISLKVHTEDELRAVRELGQGIGDLGACVKNISLSVRYSDGGGRCTEQGTSTHNRTFRFRYGPCTMSLCMRIS